MPQLFSINAPSIILGDPEIYNSQNSILSPEFIYIFAFVSINSSENEPALNVLPSSYANYTPFTTASYIGESIIPVDTEYINLSDQSAYIYVERSNNRLRLDIQLSSRPIPVVTDNIYISATFEVWSRFLNGDRKIPASRYIERANTDGSNNGIFENFTLAGGNPGNRTYLGILQPNGFYKAQFNIGLSVSSSRFNAEGSATFYYKAFISPFSIPDAPDILTGPDYFSPYTY